MYRGVRGGEFVLHPSSTLHRAKPEWVMAADIVETTRRYARTVAAIRPQWLETVAAHLLRKRHAEPRWDRGSGRVVCTERLALFGREIGRGRTADFGPVEPARARELFIHHALVERDFDCGEDFFEHNGRLLEELAELERRRRRHDVLADASLQYAFYDRRLPAAVRDARSLKQWLGEVAAGGGARRGRGRPRRGGDADERPLHMRLEDLLALPPGDGDSAASEPRGERLRVDSAAPRPLAAAAGLLGLDPADHPDHLEVAGSRLPLSYCNEPGSPEDGVTLTVPVGLLGRLSARRVQWLVPGRLEALVLELIRSMPKQWRRNFVPAPDVAREVTGRLRFGEGDLREQVAAALSERAGFTVPPQVLDLDRLPEDLRMRIRVLGDGGRELGADRDLDRLRSRHVGSARDALAAAADGRWTRDGLRGWDVGEVPERIELSLGGLPVYGHPALVDAGATVSLRLLESPAAAARANRLGVRRLLLLACRSELAAQLDWVPEIGSMRLRSHALPAAAPGQPAPPAFDEAFMLLSCERAFLWLPDGMPRPLPRDERAFTAVLDAGWGRLTEATAEVAGVLHSLLAWYAHVGEVMAAHRMPAFAELNADVSRQLAGLVPPDVLAGTPWPRLTQLPRYLAGIARRYERIRTIGPERDAERAREIRRWEEAVAARAAQDAERGREDPRVEALRWTLQEYRVSRFAQELGTAEPVSGSRIERLWREITAEDALGA